MIKWIKQTIEKITVKKTLCILVVLVLVVSGMLFFATSVTTYGVSNGIEKKRVEDLTKPENKRIVGEDVLRDTGLSNRYDVSEIRSIVIYEGNIDGENGDDLIVSIEFGPTDTLVVAYKNTGDGYEYLGIVGTFFTVEDIYLSPAGKLGRDIITIVENANQRIGAYEKSTLIRGFAWDGKSFDNILLIPEKISAQWNQLWVTDDPNGPSRWEQVGMTSDITYKDPVNPIIYSTEYQRYGISTDTVSRNVPEDETFVTEKERVVSQTFRWSDEWRRFILFEMIENKTGEKVAVIEDLATSPYVLSPEFEHYAYQYQIIRANGTRDFVNKDELTSIDGSEKKAVFKSMT